MAELPSLREPEPNADPATLAFEALREEVALMRRAVAGLAAERATIEIPDYSETLSKIMRASAAAAANLRVLARLPILNATTHDWARSIEQLNEPIRRAERHDLANVGEQVRHIADDMSANLRSARGAEAQRRCLLWTFSGGALAGMALWAIVLAPIFRAIVRF